MGSVGGRILECACGVLVCAEASLESFGSPSSTEGASSGKVSVTVIVVCESDPPSATGGLSITVTVLRVPSLSIPLSLSRFVCMGFCLSSAKAKACALLTCSSRLPPLLAIDRAACLLQSLLSLLLKFDTSLTSSCCFSIHGGTISCF